MRKDSSIPLILHISAEELVLVIFCLGWFLHPELSWGIIE